MFLCQINSLPRPSALQCGGYESGICNPHHPLSLAIFRSAYRRGIPCGCPIIVFARFIRVPTRGTPTVDIIIVTIVYTPELLRSCFTYILSD